MHDCVIKRKSARHVGWNSMQPYAFADCNGPTLVLAINSTQKPVLTSR